MDSEIRRIEAEMNAHRAKESEREMCSYAIFVPQQQSAHRKLKLEWTEERKTGKISKTNERTNERSIILTKILNEHDFLFTANDDGVRHTLTRNQ